MNVKTGIASVSIRTLLILACILGSICPGAAAGTGTPSQMRLAIMPFENIQKSTDPDLQALSEGIGESLIQGLKNVSTIHIVERENIKHLLKEQTFAMTGFADAKTAPKIGAILGANTLMVGSFQLLGDQLRINARFIRADTGELLAGKAFTVNGKWKEGAFQAMDDLAQNFVASFNVQTTDAQKKVITETISSTKNYDAYTYYLKGRDAFLSFNRTGFNRSIAEYQQALTLDPNYALAEAGLAYTYYYLGLLEQEVGNEFLSDWKQAELHARRAVDRAPDSVLAHVALARVYMDTDRLDDGRREVETAIKLNPNDPVTRFAAVALHIHERMRRGGELPSLAPAAIATRLGPELEELQIIQEDYPKEALLYLFGGITYANLSMDQQAQAELNKAIQLNSSLGTAAHLALVELYENQAWQLIGASNKKADELAGKAVKEAELYQKLDKSNTNPVVDLMHAFKLLIQIKPAKAMPILQHAMAVNPKNLMTLYLIFNAYAMLGRRQDAVQAVAAMESAVREQMDSGLKSNTLLLGRCLMQTGDNGRAVSYLQTYYDYLPNAPTKSLIAQAQRAGGGSGFLNQIVAVARSVIGGGQPGGTPQQGNRPPPGNMSVQQFMNWFTPMYVAQNAAGVRILCLSHRAAARNAFHSLEQSAQRGGPQSLGYLNAAKTIAVVFYQAGDVSLATEFTRKFPGM